MAVSTPARRLRGFDLASFQALCTLNYARLLHLLPDIKQTGSRASIALSYAGNDWGVLNLQVVEVCPWTCNVQLTHDYTGNWLHLPSLAIRVYHDLRLAEVVVTPNGRPFFSRYPYPNAAMHQPDEKNQLNGFLAQCLNHCLAVGHKALPV